MIYFVGLHCGYQLLHTCVISLTKILNGTNWASCQETMSSRELDVRESSLCASGDRLSTTFLRHYYRSIVSLYGDFSTLFRF